MELEPGAEVPSEQHVADRWPMAQSAGARPCLWRCLGTLQSKMEVFQAFLVCWSMANLDWNLDTEIQTESDVMPI